MRDALTDVGKIVNEIWGYSGKYQLALIDIFARYKEPRNTLEIGSFKGRTGAILAKNASESHMFIEADITNCTDSAANIKKFCDTTVYYKNTLSYYALNDIPTTHFDIVHVDGSHDGKCVFNDLNLAKRSLMHDGLIIVDDFYSFQYPQITEAVYEWLHANRDMCLFFAGSFKGFICPTNCYGMYIDFTVRQLIDELNKYDCSDDVYKVGNYCLVKTSMISDCQTYSLIRNWNKTGNYLGLDSSGGNTMEVISLMPVASGEKRF